MFSSQKDEQSCSYYVYRRKPLHWRVCRNRQHCITTIHHLMETSDFYSMLVRTHNSTLNIFTFSWPQEDNLTLNVASTSPTLLFPPGSQPYDQCWQKLTSNTHTSINNWTSNLPFHSMLKLKQRHFIQTILHCPINVCL